MQPTITHGARVKAAILAQGVKLWRAGMPVSARRIGRALDLTHSAVLYHYGSSGALVAAVAGEAVRIGDPVVVPILIASRHPAAASISEADRVRYLAGC